MVASRAWFLRGERRASRDSNHHMPPRRGTPCVMSPSAATFFICVSGAMVIELGYGVLVSYVARSSNETDFELGTFKFGICWLGRKVDG